MRRWAAPVFGPVARMPHRGDACSCFWVVGCKGSSKGCLDTEEEEKLSHGLLKGSQAKEDSKCSTSPCPKFEKTILPEDPCTAAWEKNRIPIISNDMPKNWFCTHHHHRPESCDFSSVSDGIEIGRGAHGVVKKTFHQGRAIAIKTMKLTITSETKSSLSPPEMLLMHGINHPNLVQILGIQFIDDTLGMDDAESAEENMLTGSSFHGFCDIAETEDYKKYNVFMEYCDGGSLWDAIERKEFFLADTNEVPNYKKITEVALEVSIGLQYLHRLGIIHGDIKAENILLQSSRFSEKGFIAKIGDFGHCQSPSNGHSIDTSSMGTVAHMPPELLSDGKLVFKADVFSFAMLLLELMTGRQTFSGMTPFTIVPAIVQGIRPEIPANCPRKLLYLVNMCWHPERHKRPDFKSIVNYLKELLLSCAEKSS